MPDDLCKTMSAKKRQCFQWDSRLDMEMTQMHRRSKWTCRVTTCFWQFTTAEMPPATYLQSRCKLVARTMEDEKRPFKTKNAGHVSKAGAVMVN